MASNDELMIETRTLLDTLLTLCDDERLEPAGAAHVTLNARLVEINRTLSIQVRALRMAADKGISFKMFQASGVDTDDVRNGEDWYGDGVAIPGRRYYGGGYIERDGDGWRLHIHRDEWVGTLEQLERRLFEYSRDEGNFS